MQYDSMHKINIISIIWGATVNARIMENNHFHTDNLEWFSGLIIEVIKISALKTNHHNTHCNYFTHW